MTSPNRSSNSAKSEWFNADKALPKRETRVLIWPGKYGKVSVGWYDNGVWHDATESIGDEGCHSPIDVQRWMHLPPEPEGVAPRNTIYTITARW